MSKLFVLLRVQLSCHQLIFVWTSVLEVWREEREKVPYLSYLSCIGEDVMINLVRNPSPAIFSNWCRCLRKFLAQGCLYILLIN